MGLGAQGLNSSDTLLWVGSTGQEWQKQPAGLDRGVCAGKPSQRRVRQRGGGDHRGQGEKVSLGEKDKEGKSAGGLSVCRLQVVWKLTSKWRAAQTNPK